MSCWTEEMIERVLDLWKKGLTATEIGELIGKTRNAVIGKLMRLRKVQHKPVPLRMSTKVAIQQNGIVAPKVKCAATKVRGEMPVVLPPTPPPSPPELQPADGWDGIVLEVFSLKNGDCRFPIGEPVKGFCRAPIESYGTSYCPYHSRLVRRG
jgi:GcrA cell cycle regulator